MNRKHSKKRRVTALPSNTVSLYKSASSLLNVIKKADEGKTGILVTNQELQGGYGYIVADTSQDKIHWITKPINDILIYGLADVSTHHSTCINVKANATVGLGFYDAEEVAEKEAGAGTMDGMQKESAMAGISALAGAVNIRAKVDNVLDPLTLYGWLNTMLMVVEDYYTLGRGYLEVVRESSTGDIQAINFLQAKCVETGILERAGNEYVIYGYGVTGASLTKIFASYGQGKELNDMKEKTYSEVIPFVLPSNRYPLIGYPKWLAAVPAIELSQHAKQFKSDFYTNRGVLDYILVAKTSHNEKEFNAWVESLKTTTQQGNKFQSAVLQLNPDEGDVKESLEYIPMAGDTLAQDQFPKDQESLSSEIVTAHQVPPVLGNILIAGKMGATNEVINALVSFQLIAIHPHQFNFANTLSRTLGSTDNDLELTREDFNLRTVLSQMDVGKVDTIARMKEEVSTTDRDLEEGLKD